MSSFVALQRSTGQPYTIRPHAAEGARENAVGAPIPGADLTTAFQGVSRNHGVVFKGEFYFVVRLSATNGYRVCKFDGTNFVYTAILYTPAATENVRCSGLVVANNGDGEILCLCLDVYDGTAVERYARVLKSTDGSTFTTSSGTYSDVAHLNEACGISTYYKGIISISLSASGLVYYDPHDDTFGGAIFSADGANNATFGAFVHFFGRNMLFTYDTGSNELKLLVQAEDIKVAPTADKWVDSGATGFPAAGALLLWPTYLTGEGGAACAFTDGDEGLYVLIGSTTGPRMFRTTKATYPAFTEVSSSVFPPEISTRSILRFGVIGEDSNDKPREVLIHAHYPLGGTTHICSWDFTTNQMKVLITSTLGVLIGPATQRGALQVLREDGGDTLVVDPVFVETARGRYTLTYTLKNSLSRQADVSVEFTYDGVEYIPVADGGAEEPLTDRSTSPSGVSHTFDADFNIAGAEGVFDVRITARTRRP